jgi:GH25 family lysozyme M1 (1,4-beta-N-acetylmuramidase)
LSTTIPPENERAQRDFRLAMTGKRLQVRGLQAALLRNTKKLASVQDPIFGFDISDHQGPNVNFGRLRSEGYRFGFIKATEGIGWTARYYKDNMQRARAAGIQAGAYHFLWGNDPVKQVGGFLRAVGNPEGKMLCVDVETYPGQAKPYKQHLWGFIKELGNRVGKEHPIVVYSGDWYYKGYMGNPDLNELRRQGYNVTIWSTPDSGYVEGPGTEWGLYQSVPASEWGWGFGNTKMLPKGILQYSAEAYAANVNPMDVNAFAGSESDLKSLAHPATTSPEPPPRNVGEEVETMPVTDL